MIKDSLPGAVEFIIRQWSLRLNDKRLDSMWDPRVLKWDSLCSRCVEFCNLFDVFRVEFDGICEGGSSDDRSESEGGSHRERRAEGKAEGG